MTSRFTHAFVRPPTPSLADCQLLHLPRQPFDFGLAAAQHRNYVAALTQHGLRIANLPVAPELPDAVFVEDTLVMLDEIAIVCRPGAASRLAETDTITAEVARLHPTAGIRAPGTLEGGDVLRIDRTLYVGRSTRTNQEGIRQLAQIVSPFGYELKEVVVNGCLHLKTAITSPGNGLVLANPAWLDLSAFRRFELLSVPAIEPWGANTLPLNGRVLVAASAPKTGELLDAKGLDVRLVDISELQKAEAGLTCMSVVYYSL